MSEHSPDPPPAGAPHAWSIAVLFALWMGVALVAAFALIQQFTTPPVPPEMRDAFPSADVLHRMLLTVGSTGLSVVLCVALWAIPQWFQEPDVQQRRLFLAALAGEFLLLLLALFLGLVRLLHHLAV